MQRTWCSKDLALASFPLAPLCSFTQSYGSDDTWLPEIEDRELLRVSRLWEKQISNLILIHDFTWSWRSNDMFPIESNGQELLLISGLWEKKISNFILLHAFIQS
jgi:hypothetical protein